MSKKAWPMTEGERALALRALNTPQRWNGVTYGTAVRQPDGRVRVRQWNDLSGRYVIRILDLEAGTKTYEAEPAS